jgi:hypothetical protein
MMCHTAQRRDASANINPDSSAFALAGEAHWKDAGTRIDCFATACLHIYEYLLLVQPRCIAAKYCNQAYLTAAALAWQANIAALQKIV